MPITQVQKVDFACAVARALSRVFRDKNANMPDVVWHYTSHATLLKILESKSLWATHVSCVNDTSEVTHLFSLLFAYMDCLKADPEMLALLDFVTGLKDRDRGASSEWFVTSFCTESDDLNLWRAYAGTDGGVAIGFDNKEMLRRAWNDESRGGREGLPETYVLPVEYSEEKKKDLVQSLVEETARLFKAGLASQKPDAWAEEFWAAWEGQIAVIAPLIKDSAFESEKEWRLVTRLQASSRATLKFLARRTTISRHLPLELRPVATAAPQTLPITEIKIGPGWHSGLTKANVEELLSSKGYTGVLVTCSSIPFRAL